jgi:hypothetical protein
MTESMRFELVFAKRVYKFGQRCVMHTFGYAKIYFFPKNVVVTRKCDSLSLIRNWNCQRLRNFKRISTKELCVFV